jgi:protein TonB
VTSRIAQSSGSASLDAETLALIGRAQPFPPPPADITEEQLSFVVAIRYAASARR